MSPETRNKENLEYAAECQRESDMVTVQGGSRFLIDLHRFRAELATMEAGAGDA